MRNKTIVGIDQSFASTGFVRLNSLKEIEHVDILMSKITDPIHYRIHNIASQITSLITADDYVFIEGLPFKSFGNATRDLAGLQSVIIEHLIYFAIVNDVTIVPPKTLKTFATGNGKATKQDVFDECPKDVQYVITDYIESYNAKNKIKLKPSQKYDLADAYWLARYGVVSDMGV